MKILIKLCFLLLLPGIAPAQSGFEKCSPSIQMTARSTNKQTYQLVVRDLPAFIKLLEQKTDFEVLATYAPAGIVVVRTRFSVLQNQLLPLPDLLYVDRGAAAFHEELPVPGHNLLVNKINAQQARYPTWNGAGRTVSVKEYLFDTLDVDLWGRVAPVLNGANQLSPHAALMATLVAGAGNSGTAGRGAAWAARLAASDFAGLLPDDDAVYESQNISVQNHSYGVGIENYYGADAMAYDQSVSTRPALLHVFSAGNSGDSSAILGTYSGLNGFANLSGSFKMAKNVLLVGAADSFGQVTPFSSRGPAYDGRIKPDLVAFGQDGSSGAAALVSGVAAVLQQAYAERHQGSLPQAALLRALLINGAGDVGRPGPDYVAGFGNLNALRSAEIFDSGHFTTSALGNQDVFFLEIEAPANSRLLKLTLAWDDLAALAGAPTALVNDLDIKVIGPDGQKEYLPFVLNAAPDVDSLNLLATQGIDTLNTVEQIAVLNPVPGTYKIEIRASRVGPGLQQDFALVYHWVQSDTFCWIAPARERQPTAGSPTVLYWDQSFDQMFGRLEFRFIDQLNWNLIDLQAELQAGVYRWTVPDTFGLVQLRMTIDGQDFLSDTFLISKELQLKVGYFCPDSALIHWKPAAPQAIYQVWGLGNQYLEPLFSTSDTFAVLNRAVYPQDRFALATTFAPFQGIRSGAVDISERGLDCYFRNFLAEFNEEQQIRLQFELGTTYGLDQIFLEKWQAGGGFSPVMTWSKPFSGVYFETIDAKPFNGPNRYRVRLLAPDGQIWLSDTLVLHYGGPGGFWIYPNPASGQGLLQVSVQAPSDELKFVLFDLFGRFLFEKTLDETLLAIPLPALTPGFYPYLVSENGRRLLSGKLLVLKQK